MRRLLLAACLLVLPSLAQAQPLFRQIISAAEAPDYNWGNVNEDEYGVSHTVTRVAGGSPSGNDSLRIVGIVVGTNTQTGSHLFRAMPETSVPQGAARYIRWRVYIAPNPVWPSNVGGTNNNSAAGKVIIMGNGCGFSGDRFIVSLEATNSTTRANPSLHIGKGVGSDFHSINLTPDTWYSVQHRITTSSTDATADAEIATWVNADNATEGSPTNSNTGFTLNSEGYGSDLGCQLQHGIDTFNYLSDALPNASLDIQIADFEYDDAFDDTWGDVSGEPEPPSTTPYRFRFGAADWLVGTGALASVWCVPWMTTRRRRLPRRS